MNLSWPDKIQLRVHENGLQVSDSHLMCLNKYLTMEDITGQTIRGPANFLTSIKFLHHIKAIMNFLRSIKQDILIHSDQNGKIRKASDDYTR